MDIQEHLDKTWYFQFHELEWSRFNWSPWTYFAESNDWTNYEN